MERGHRHLQDGVGGQAGPAQGLAVAGQTLLGGAVAQLRLRPDRRDPAAPGLHQVTGRLVGRQDVVHRHVVRDLPGVALPQQHHRRGARLLRQLRRPEGQRGEDDPVDRVDGESPRDLELDVPVAAGLLDEHAIPPEPRHLDHDVRQLGEVRRVDPRDRQGEGPGPPLPQLAAREARAVAELGDDALDTFSRRGPHPARAVHDVGDGLPGDARRSRDVLDPRRPAPYAALRDPARRHTVRRDLLAHPSTLSPSVALTARRAATRRAPPLDGRRSRSPS